MKTFRIVAGILALLPLGLLIYHISFESDLYDPNSMSTMAFLVLSVPILTINFWAWFEPEIIEFIHAGG